MKPTAQDVELSRDVDAIVIPHGYRTHLAKGTKLRVLQTLGDSATVTADFGGLFRLDGDQLDAIGIDAPERPGAGAGEDRPLEDRIWDELRTCYDPEIPVNIVELGLVYDCRLDEPRPDGRRNVHIKMTLTAPGCPVAGSLPGEVERKIETIDDVPAATVELVWEPQWTKDRMSEAALLELGLL